MGWGGVLRHCYILHLIGFGGEDGELVGGRGGLGGMCGIAQDLLRTDFI